MIIAQTVAPHPTKTGLLRVQFNCVANESAPHFMDIDTVYIYMKAGETVQLDLPANMDIQQGQRVLLSKIAAPYTQQNKDWNLAWTIDELPEPSNLHMNMVPPAILKY